MGRPSTRRFLAAAALAVASLGAAAGARPLQSDKNRAAEELRKLEERYRGAKNDRDRVDVLFDAAKQLGTADALRFILKEIDQPTNAYLGDRAIAAFASTSNGPALSEVAKEAFATIQEPRLRRAVLEALISTKAPITTEVALPCLGDTDLETKLLALELFLQKKAAKLPLEIPKLAGGSGKDDKVRATALLAWSACDPTGAAKAVAAAAKDKSSRVRIASLLALESSGGAVGDRATAFLTDADRRVRLTALSAVQKVRPASAVPRLIELVGKEEGRVRERAVSVLQEITQRNFGTDVGAWTRWWDQVGPNFVPPAVAGASEKRKGKPEESANREGTRVVEGPRYYEFVVASDRVAFLVDVSGSMRAEYTPPGETSAGGTRTKLEQAARALRECLLALPKGTKVTILVFNNGPLRFRFNGKETGLDVDAKLAEEAYRFVVSIGANNATNINDSLELVIEDPEVDTVYLLTDGEPSAGRRNLGSRICDWVRRTIRFARTEINTVGLGADPRGTEFLKRLAEAGEGKAVSR